MFSKSLLPVLALAISLGNACGFDRHQLRSSLELNEALSKRNTNTVFPPSLTEHESILTQSFNNNTISDWSYYYTHGLHVAGTNRSMAQWTADRWSEFGVPSHLVSYNVFLNYPVSHSLSVTHPDGSTWEASLEEAVLAEDPTTSYPNRVPTFHGYSANGEAEAELVYVGRGQRADFERLLELGVDLKGKIAISRYGGSFRGLKVLNAQKYGMLGAILFTDPGDDGNITVANGYEAYPDGPARHPTAVQRGSVMNLALYPGDPTTPGYPSHDDAPRADRSRAVPQIPSLPISYEDAVPILSTLDGHGVAGEDVNRPMWVGALDVTYSTGPSKAKISMSNEMKDTYTDIWDTIGVINGTSPDEVVVIGNHRDAWMVGGAGDPNSGSAVMVELAKAFGKLQDSGWKPRRTIVMCSWDAEEYGLVGSTEWLEDHVPWLRAATVSYLNVDTIVSGPLPHTSATPQLHKIAMEAMKKIVYPYEGHDSTTLYDVWKAASGEIGVLGSGSDYTAFLHNGIPSLDMGAGGGPDDPIYMYHSNYDSFHWMTNFGDPQFKTHSVMGQYLGLVAYHLASEKIIPFAIPNYVDELNEYYHTLEHTISESNLTSLDITPIKDAINTFKEAATEANTWMERARNSNDDHLINHVNHKLRDFERGFVSQGGLPGRIFYKHVLFAPGQDTGYAPVVFPGVTEAVLVGDRAQAEEWIKKTSDGIRVAAGVLTP